MRGRKNRTLQVPPVVPYKALGNFPKALYGTTRGTSSAKFFQPVMGDAAVIERLRLGRGLLRMTYPGLSTLCCRRRRELS